MKDISIIVPVYNSEKYIKRCLDSLVNQTCKSKEIIIVNDGSTDNSLKIISYYKQKYPDIIVIDKKNGGVSSARNVGLEKATGKYISFVDSDDWCEKDMYEDMIKLSQEMDYDIVCSGYCMDSNTGKNIAIAKSDRIYRGKESENIGEILHLSNVSYCFAKIYKKEIIDLNNIRFKENLSMGEDAVFTCDYLCNIKTIGLIDKAYYHYVRSNSESLSTKYIHDIDIFINMVWDRLDILYSKYPYFKELEHSDGSTREINSSKMYLYNNYRKGCTLNAKERRNDIKTYMFNDKINKQMRLYNPITTKDKLYYLLFNIKSPFIMDSVYSLRIGINNIIGRFKGIKK